MSIASLISKDFNQISAEQKSENFKLYHKILDTSVCTSTAWKNKNNSFHIILTLFARAEFLSASQSSGNFLFCFSFCAFVHKGHCKCYSLICLPYFVLTCMCHLLLVLYPTWYLRMIFLKFKYFTVEESTKLTF